MADKPSRALVLYGDGLARFLNPSHTHLHSLASLASCGFLALPHYPPSENEGARIIREFAELLDACEAYNENAEEFAGGVKSEDKSVTASLSERFTGMKAALITQNSHLKCFGNKIGLTTLQLNDLVGVSHSLEVSQLLASELLKLLGFEEGKTLETSQFDIIIVHIGAGEEQNGLLDTEQMNDLVGTLLCSAQPGTEISSRLHLSVLMSYGAVSGNENSELSLSVAKDENNSELSPFYPRQSYTMKGGKPRDNVRHQNPILIAQWQNAVTRKDMVDTYSFADFKENVGNLVIPADRFLHEVAFKLWKAPKYGA
ncbi:hypothetical protein M9H77_19574 [Catharanthus roseus]|uniref:Uncharacterized protein n=1 Tax=Catharanthus roseus TaxID=4058 RepID=A0ACC0BAP8_CATRO|nr:hypothetical protein M9H77_19574 [Catharanthus roseus]